MSVDTRICLLGYGEVGQILGDDLADRAGIRTGAFDLQFDDPRSEPSEAARSRRHIDAHGSASAAVAGADVVISAVTASEALNAAESAAGSLEPGAFYVDVNSVSPETKEAVSRVIAPSGAKFVEAVLMAPIGPRRIESVFLLGGPNAASFGDHAAELGFTGVQVFSERIGAASAVKMCRSVVVKGTEALLAEALTTARTYGVEDVVLDSLGNVLPLPDWPATAEYMLSRTIQHGKRRAEEMREAVATVEGAGVQPLMARATVARQDEAARTDHQPARRLKDILDTLIAASGESEEGEPTDG